METSTSMQTRKLLASSVVLGTLLTSCCIAEACGGPPLIFPKLVEEGHYQEALVEIERQLKLRSLPGSGSDIWMLYMWRAVIYHKYLKNDSLALRAANKSLQEYDMPHVRVLRGEIEEAMGNTASAMQDYSAVIQRLNHYSDAFEKRANLKHKLQDSAGEESDRQAIAKIEKKEREEREKREIDRLSTLPRISSKALILQINKCKNIEPELMTKDGYSSWMNDHKWRLEDPCPISGAELSQGRRVSLPGIQELYQFKWGFLGLERNLKTGNVEVVSLRSPWDLKNKYENSFKKDSKEHLYFLESLLETMQQEPKIDEDAQDQIRHELIGALTKANQFDKALSYAKAEEPEITGGICRAAGRKEDAVKYYREAISDCPDPHRHPRNYLLLGSLEPGTKPTKVWPAGWSQKNLHKMETHYLLARTLLSLNRFDEAKAVLAKLDYPNAIESLFLQAQIDLAAKKNLKRVIENLEKAASGFYDRALIKDRDEALKLLKQAKQLQQVAITAKPISVNFSCDSNDIFLVNSPKKVQESQAKE